jgi:hypothetical protein
LLLAVPVGLSRLHTDVVDPVSTGLKAHHVDILVTQLVCHRFVIGHHVGRSGDVSKDVGVDTRHVDQRVLLNRVLVVLLCEHIVERELALDALTLEVLGELYRYAV